MNLLERLLPRQREMCAAGCGRHLPTLRATPGLHRYLPPGRTAVEVDHIVALADGGSNELDNLQLLCGWCHHDKTVTERPGWVSQVVPEAAGRIESRGGAIAAERRGARRAKARRIGTAGEPQRAQRAQRGWRP